MFVRQRRRLGGTDASATLSMATPEDVKQPELRSCHRLMLINRSTITTLVLVVLSIVILPIIWRVLFAHNNHQDEQDTSFDQSSLPLSKFSELSYALKNSDLVALYFAASWCPMSTPVSLALDRAFGKTGLLLTRKGGRKSLAVVYVSSDKTLEEFEGYIRNREWLAVPYESDQRSELKRHFSTCAKIELDGLKIDRMHEIPTIIVIDSKTHGIITSDGAYDVDQMGEDSLQHWRDIQDWTTNIETETT